MPSKKTDIEIITANQQALEGLIQMDNADLVAIYDILLKIEVLEAAIRNLLDYARVENGRE